jgi:mannose-6-phosphate isomerase-like protein (cupin superfamily)
MRAEQESRAGRAPRKIGPGDFVLVPEKTPHWFTQIDGALVLMSIHLPR